MFFKVLVEEKKQKPTIQEPPKKVPAKPDQAIAVEEPPKKGIEIQVLHVGIFSVVFVFLY